MHYALFQNIKIKHSKAPSFAGANVSLILGHFQKCLTRMFPIGPYTDFVSFILNYRLKLSSAPQKNYRTQCER